MKITGIIAEYNPLHAGHLRHMALARERTGCDYIVCVMSGSFTQRGEPAAMDKFARAELALRAGADAVAELPAVYAVRPAQQFAMGGVDILCDLGIDCLSFGCETEDLRALDALSRLQDDPALSEKLRENLAQGKSYPRALSEAAPGMDALLRCPNAVLGAEYLRQLRRRGSSAEICPVLRDAPYHSDGADTHSASGVRQLLRDGKPEEAIRELPEDLKEIYRRETAFSYREDALDAYILMRLRTMDPDSVATPDAAEGLAQRIKKLAQTTPCVSALIEEAKCKRYTRARICRVLVSAYLDLPAVPENAPYLRLLGTRKEASPLLKELDRRSGGRLVTSAAELRDHPVFRAECRATDLWGLGSENPAYRTAGREFTAKFLRI